ncbi:hypothetical protein QZH41_012173, partial [Actinostola sp. cb2023]
MLKLSSKTEESPYMILLKGITCLSSRDPKPVAATQRHLSNGRGKKSAWQAWEAYPDVTPAIESLATNPFQQLQIESEIFRKLERLTIIMYDKSSPLESVNETRMVIFCKHNRSMEKLPPTQ